ncbi:hypothetical protein GCM10011425_03760 [Mucilaginibacter galii]|uniref:Uncharacterized protein n=1 Tax=Mucilaginibacter galii TaxID=2005073 RepID=A0A917J5Q1_9SPHI|nr:hypothetical protein [Mucilaginibacter galii]GGI49164.1 hypothetical protein GCM10011425_03760 [Mucilaginibacter galii]
MNTQKTVMAINAITNNLTKRQMSLPIPRVMKAPPNPPREGGLLKNVVDEISLKYKSSFLLERAFIKISF